MVVNWKVTVFRGKDYCVVFDFSWKEKFWLKVLRINHGTKEVVVPAKKEINWKWMWLWSWLWNAVYMWIDMKHMFFLK
jgi:hypothetical protein